MVDAAYPLRHLVLSVELFELVGISVDAVASASVAVDVPMIYVVDATCVVYVAGTVVGVAAV